MKFEPNKLNLKQLYFKPDFTYTIPQYQRPYSWKKENLEGFWDLVNTGETKYLGTVIYNVQDFSTYKQKEIIDGQQRYLTITILAASMRDSFLEHYKNTKEDKSLSRARTIQKLLIAQVDDITEEYSNYLITGQSSKSYFENNIQKFDEEFIHNSIQVKIIDKPQNSEQKLIEQAYAYFKTQIQNEITNHGVEQTFMKVIENISELFVISIEIDNYTMAFEIFESVNGQGVDLSVSDLIKNQIFRNVPKEDLIKAETKWNEINENLENLGVKISPQEFLRYYWASIYEYVPDAKLYNAITTEVKKTKQNNEWLKLLDGMHKDSEELNTFLNYSSEEWKTYLSDRKEADLIYKSLRTLKSIKGKTWLVLVMSILRNNHAIRSHGLKVGQFIQKVQEFTFVYFSVMGMPSNWFWIQMHSSARAIEKSKTKQEFVSAFEKLLKEFGAKLKMISDIEFKEQLKTIQYSNNNLPIIYYILTEIELSLHSKTSVGFDPSKINVEHFLPQEPKEWGLTKTQIKNKVNLLGNLLLISSNLNGMLGNKPCLEKVKIIKDNNANEMFLMRELIEKIEDNSWKFSLISNNNFMAVDDAIDSRQNSMANYAYKIWIEGLKRKLGY